MNQTNTSTTYQLTLISLYEWNKITITVSVPNTSGQETIYIFTNYDFKNFITISAQTADSQDLNYLAFCGQKKSETVTCSPGGTQRSIQWGSAYYSNIRIWQNGQFLKTPAVISQEYVSQSFNIL